MKTKQHYQFKIIPTYLLNILNILAITIISSSNGYGLEKNKQKEEETYLKSNHKHLEIEERMIDLEIKQLSSKILWSGEFINSIDYYNYTKEEPTDTKKVHTLMQSVFKLHNAMNILKGAHFYSTLKAGYPYNNNIFNTTDIQDSSIIKNKGSFIEVEKAYADITLISQELIFSIGRLPTIEGPPTHLYSTGVRQGTYPILSFSMPIDGIAITWKTRDTFKLKDKLSITYLAAPFSQANTSYPWDGNDSSKYNNLIAKAGFLHILMTEYGTKRVPYIEYMSFIFQTYEFSLGRPRAISDVTGPINPDYSDDNNQYELSSLHEKLIDVHGIVAYTELNNIFNLNIDLYANYKYNYIKSKGQIKATVSEDNNGIPDLNFGDSFNIGGYLIDGETSGNSYLLGIRYTFNVKYHIGYEYLMSPFLTLPTSIHLQHNSDFYNTVGNGNHTYFTYTNNGGALTMRFGYMKAVNDYQFKLMKYYKAKYEIKNVYALLTLKF